MVKKNLLLLFSFFLLGSQGLSSQPKTNDLPVIDFSKNYPQKKICLQDIAESEYVPLETTDDVLLSENAALSAVSDKYILIYERLRGDIFVFNRTGEIVHHFNHKGQSGQEYAWIAGLVFDDKNEEIFVCNRSIQVYSLNGTYKRTLKINTIQNESKVYNFDDNTLLVYDDVIVDPGFEKKTKEDPYRLMSKKDGSLISVLDFHLPKRYSSQFIKKEENNRYRTIIMYFPQNKYYGKDFMLADISSDTLYMLTQDKKLTPILTRKPSVHASEPRSVWATFLTTDKFMLIGLILLEFNSKEGKIPEFMYDFETGEISKVSFTDTESVRREWYQHSTPAIAKNQTAELVQASEIVGAYRKKLLKGKAEKSVMALNEDDNPVVRIIKFK